MRDYFRTEIDRLRSHMERLGQAVIDNIDRTSRVLLHAEAGQAQAVLRAERRVDAAEVRIEEECLKVIALHQPVADDLRFLIGIMKVDHEMERIGDLTANIARHAQRLLPHRSRVCRERLRSLSDLSRDLIVRGLQAFLSGDVQAAKGVWRDDDAVDELCGEWTRQIREDLSTGRDATHHEGQPAEIDPANVRHLLELLFIVADFERMADHGVNIAKTGIYRALGSIARHRGREFRADAGTVRPADGRDPAAN